MSHSEYWVQVKRAVQDHSRVIGYGVHHYVGHHPECVKLFSVSRNGGWEVALHLANTLRDDLNAKA